MSALMKLEFYRQIFQKKKKKSRIKFYHNPSSGSRVVASERSDGPTGGSC
jgi:hypothetical protein